MTFYAKTKLIDLLVWVLIILVPITAVVSLAVLLKLVQVARQNGVIAAQSRNYTRCLAEVFVKAQTERVTSLDLDHCSTTTQANPTPAPVVVPQNNQTAPDTTQGVPVPSRGTRSPQNSTQTAPQPTPKPCTINLLICL